MLRFLVNSLEVTSVLKDSQHNFFLRIKGMIPALVVVIVAAVPPAIPAILQLIHTCTAGQLADFFQNRLILRLAVAGDSTGVYFQGCKQNILFGIHDGQYIFEALQELGERKIALFCCIPDSDKSLNYLVGMIYTQLIQTLYCQADRIHKGRLPVPVHCLMDEYANLSLPKDTFLSALATMR